MHIGRHHDWCRAHTVRFKHFRLWHTGQVWNEQDPSEETLALVVRTGLCTTMGAMLRHVMAPVNITIWLDPFVKVLYHVLCTLLGCQTIPWSCSFTTACVLLQQL